MTRATPEMRRFAEHLIACENSKSPRSSSGVPPVFDVCDALRPHLATFMGSAGFAALLGRAMSLAVAEAPALHSLSVTPDGHVEGLEDGGLSADSLQLHEGGVVLLAHLLGLLQVFIGETLTVQLVRDVWPDLVYNGLGRVKGDTK